MTIKQEFMAIMDLMDEQDLRYALNLIKDNFALRKKGASWENIEEIDPDDDDFLLLNKVQSKVDGYGEYLSHEELIQMLHS